MTTTNNSTSTTTTGARRPRRRNLFTEPWTLTVERTLCGAWWAIVPEEDAQRVTQQHVMATIDTCGHQHQTEASLQTCPNRAEMAATIDAHTEGLAEYQRRIELAGRARNVW